MNFRPELAAKVMSGDKRVTRRLTSKNPNSPWYEGGCKLVVGRDYAICPGRGKPAIGRARVTGVTLERLGHLTDLEAQREGFEDALAFMSAWRAINGAYDKNVKVWRIALEPIGYAS